MFTRRRQSNTIKSCRDGLRFWVMCKCAWMCGAHAAKRREKTCEEAHENTGSATTGTCTRIGFSLVLDPSRPLSPLLNLAKHMNVSAGETECSLESSTYNSFPTFWSDCAYVQDLEEAKKENHRLNLENNRLDLENKRVLRELEFGSLLVVCCQNLSDTHLNYVQICMYEWGVCM